ncbi:hypothetical protein AMTRI_Chr04g183390 [Amborella trichopoda]
MPSHNLTFLFLIFYCIFSNCMPIQVLAPLKPPQLVYPSSNSHEFCNFSAVSSPLLNSPQMVKLLVLPLRHLETLLFQEDQPCKNMGFFGERECEENGRERVERKIWD